MTEQRKDRFQCPDCKSLGPHRADTLPDQAVIDFDDIIPPGTNDIDPMDCLDMRGVIRCDNCGGEGCVADWHYEECDHDRDPSGCRDCHKEQAAERRIDEMRDTEESWEDDGELYRIVQTEEQEP